MLACKIQKRACTIMPVFNRLWYYWFAYQGRIGEKRSLKWLADVAGGCSPTFKRYLDNTIGRYHPTVKDKLCRPLDLPIADFPDQSGIQYPALRRPFWLAI